MAEVVNYAITTKERVKSKLGMDEKDFDIILDRLCNAVTDFIEGQTNRRFKSTTYSNEVYNILYRQRFLTLKQTPVTNLSVFQYSLGLPNSRTWVDVPASDYELDPDPNLGMIRAYYTLLRGIAGYRVTYTAGYLIDFDNIDDQTKHTLPADLSELAEKLIIKWFKNRENPGKNSEMFQGAKIEWKKELDEEDKFTIEKYKRLVFI